MKIAVWLDKDYKPEEGGGFSYYDRLVKSIDAFTFDKPLDICFVTEGEVTSLGLSKDIIRLYYNYKVSFLKKVLSLLPYIGKIWKRKIKKQRQKTTLQAYEKQLTQAGVKFIYYIRQTECALPDFPFVATNWDIGHCSTYAFPELIADGEFERRTSFYTKVLPKALLVFAESEEGKNELIKYTTIDERKLKIVPIFAGNCVTTVVSEQEQADILATYSLTKDTFFFYPAQFWAHKNHYTLLKSFAELVHAHPSYKLVLTGSDKGNLNYIKQLAQDWNIADKVLFLGFLPIEHINTFFRNATALIMASHFGPSNMPPLEAMELACPVIASDTIGHKEMLGKAALYFDAMDSNALLVAMNKMIAETPSYKQAIVERQKTSVFNVEYALNQINIHLKEAVSIRQNWN